MGEFRTFSSEKLANLKPPPRVSANRADLHRLAVTFGYCGIILIPIECRRMQNEIRSEKEGKDTGFA
mgnify:CR=1 FL=1